MLYPLYIGQNADITKHQAQYGMTSLFEQLGLNESDSDLEVKLNINTFFLI